jgi:uncharacterized protein (TIGR02246 family)
MASTHAVAPVREIQSVHEAWIAAELAGNIEGVLALCTDDVRWLVPGDGEAVGLAAGRKLLSRASGRPEGIRTTDVRIEVSGDLACKTSRFETHYRLPESGRLAVAHGLHLWILRRVDRSWRVALVTWHLDR